METMYWWIIGLGYLAMCIGVSVEAAARRHDGFPVFMFCLFFSPLIGAIMYSHYKEKEEEVEEDEEEDKEEDEEEDEEEGEVTEEPEKAIRIEI